MLQANQFYYTHFKYFDDYYTYDKSFPPVHKGMNSRIPLQISAFCPQVKLLGSNVTRPFFDLLTDLSTNVCFINLLIYLTYLRLHFLNWCSLLNSKNK